MSTLNDTLTLLGFATTPLELISFILAVCTVLLTIRQNHWGWLLTIISSSTYGVVFHAAKLYGDMALQGVFILVALWGWRQWLRGAAGSGSGSASASGALAISRLDRRGWRLALLGWLIGFIVLAVFLRRCTDSDVSNMDGFLTAGSLLGQLLLSRKKLENWSVWIVVDILYVGLYIHKNLMLTAFLYAIFVLMALAGLRAWRRADGVTPATPAQCQ